MIGWPNGVCTREGFPPWVTWRIAVDLGLWDLSDFLLLSRYLNRRSGPRDT